MQLFNTRMEDSIAEKYQHKILDLKDMEDLPSLTNLFIKDTGIMDSCMGRESINGQMDLAMQEVI